MRSLLIAVFTILISLPISSQNQSDTTNQAEHNKFVNELIILKKDYESLHERTSDLKDQLKDYQTSSNSNIKNLEEKLSDRISSYVIGASVIIFFLGWLLNFLGKAAIAKGLETTVNSTIEQQALKILKDQITEDYISQLISQKGEHSINKLLSQLEVKAHETIESIKTKGDKAIDTFLATPELHARLTPNDLLNDKNIKQQQIRKQANEFFQLAYQSKNYHVKISLYNKALELEPDNMLAMNNLAVAFSEIGQPDEAIEILDKAITENQDFALAYANRANCYIKKREFKTAIEDTDTAISKNPKLELAYSLKGNALMSLGKEKEAERILSEAIEINPESSTAYFFRGIFYEETHKYKESENDYLKAQSLGYPKKESVYNNLAVLYRRQNKLDLAIEYIEKAKEIDSDDPLFDGTLALIYADKGDESQFYHHLRIALEKGCPVWKYLDDPGFEPYKNTDKLTTLIEAYKPKKK